MPLIKKKPKPEPQPAPVPQMACPDHGALPEGAVTCACGEQGA